MKTIIEYATNFIVGIIQIPLALVAVSIMLLIALYRYTLKEEKPFPETFYDVFVDCFNNIRGVKVIQQ
jgi:hypothetical protein